MAGIVLEQQADDLSEAEAGDAVIYSQKNAKMTMRKWSTNTGGTVLVAKVLV